MDKSLLPLTRFVIAMSAIVPFVLGLGMFFAPAFVNRFLWPPPFEPVPAVVLRYQAVAYFALTLGGAYAFRQNDWGTARRQFSGCMSSWRSSM